MSGTGGDTYRLVYQQEKPEEAGEALHPHSIWMSLLSDTGIVAFLAFAAFAVGLFVVAAQNALLRQRSRQSRAIIAGATAAAYLISSSVDWNWYIPAAALPFFVLAAVAAGMTYSRRQDKTSSTAL